VWVERGRACDMHSARAASSPSIIISLRAREPKDAANKQSSHCVQLHRRLSQIPCQRCRLLCVLVQVPSAVRVLPCFRSFLHMRAASRSDCLAWLPWLQSTGLEAPALHAWYVLVSCVWCGVGVAREGGLCTESGACTRSCTLLPLDSRRRGKAARMTILLPSIVTRGSICVPSQPAPL